MISAHVARLCFGPAVIALAACSRGVLVRPPAENALTITHVTLIDGSGGPPQSDMTLVVQGNRIVRVGPSSSTHASGTVIHGRGLYAMPGMWDMHVHIAGVENVVMPLMLAAGVTTVRDLGGGCAHLGAIRDSIRAGLKEGARIMMAGRILESEGELATHARIRRRADSLGIPTADFAEPGCRRIVVRNSADVELAIDSVVAAGGDLVKARSYADSTLYSAIAAAARRRNLTFAAHPPYVVNAVRSASAGTTTLEHGFYPWPPSSITPTERQEMLRGWKTGGTHLVPTFVTWEPRGLHIDSVRAEVNDSVGGHGVRRARLPKAIADRWRASMASRSADGRENLAAWRKVLDDHMKDIGDMYRAGVRILPGTDSPNNALVYPGVSLIDELELFVRGAGVTPMQAIQSATAHAAEAMRMDSLGTIAPGKLADIVLLSEDPVADIRNLRNVAYTIANGRIVYRAAASRQPSPSVLRQTRF